MENKPILRKDEIIELDLENDEKTIPQQVMDRLAGRESEGLVLGDFNEIIDCIINLKGHSVIPAITIKGGLLSGCVIHSEFPTWIVMETGKITHCVFKNIGIRFTASDGQVRNSAFMGGGGILVERGGNYNLVVNNSFQDILTE